MKKKVKLIVSITLFLMVFNLIFSFHASASSASGISSGQTYWIVNAHSGKVLDVNSKNNVIQWKNNNGSNQKWKVVYNSSGDYYTISPTNKSNYYLSTASTSLANGTNVCITSGSSSNTTRWAIEKKSTNGNYIIRSKIKTTFVLTTQGAKTSDGANVMAYTYSSGNNCNDEWIFVNSSGYSIKSVSIAIQQDKSYLERFSSQPYEINKVIADATKPFYSRWHIEFRPSYYNLSSMKMDTCPNGYIDECTTSNCGSICENRKGTPNHHKNFDYNALNAWNNYGMDGNSIRFITVGADLCHKSAGKHSKGALGMASGNNCMAEQNRGHMLNVRVVQHELSHVYGAKDCGNKATPCIMSGGFDKNYTYNLTSIWCADCTKNFDRTRY